jgi:hypothetical protein
MSKRIKDPKGDLRFVHKSARPSGFRVLKLTAMAGCRRVCEIQKNYLRPSGSFTFDRDFPSTGMAYNHPSDIPALQAYSNG